MTMYMPLHIYKTVNEINHVFSTCITSNNHCVSKPSYITHQ